MLGLKTPRIAAKWKLNHLTCVMTLVVLNSIVLFIDDGTLMKLVGLRTEKRVVEEEAWPLLAHEKELQAEKRKRKPPPHPKPALTLPEEDIENHIEGLSKTRNMSGIGNGKNVFADQFLTSLLNDDFLPIPMSKVHNNRLILNADIARIPNVVNLIQFNQFKYDWSDYFTFARYVTFKSVERYIKPGLILFWGDHVPWGSEWWNRTLHEVPNIYYVFAPPVFELGHQKVQFIQHKSDWLRLDVLYRYGGIYLDNDVIVLRPFSDLMNYVTVMSRDTPESLGTGVILSQNGTRFMSKWAKLYEQYMPKVYNINSNRVAHTLATSKHQAYLHFLVKVLPGNFTDPYPKRHQKYILYCGHYDLQYNYAVHMYKEKEHVVPSGFKELEGYNCTLGDAMRIALYGNPKLLNTKNATDGCSPRK